MSINPVDTQERQVLRVLVADDERLPRQQLIDSLMQCEPRLGSRRSSQWATSL